MNFCRSPICAFANLRTAKTAGSKSQGATGRRGTARDSVLTGHGSCLRKSWPSGGSSPHLSIRVNLMDLKFPLHPFVPARKQSLPIPRFATPWPKAVGCEATFPRVKVDHPTPQLPSQNSRSPSRGSWQYPPSYFMPTRLLKKPLLLQRACQDSDRFQLTRSRFPLSHCRNGLSSNCFHGPHRRIGICAQKIFRLECNLRQLLGAIPSSTGIHKGIEKKEREGRQTTQPTPPSTFFGLSIGPTH